MKSKVTIAVPVYGVETFIERCARSLFEQTCMNIEYIFVDDCSLDNSINILYDVINDYPERAGHVRIIKHEYNRGLGAARNTAVDNCCTEFIMHVDSDDFIAPDTIDKVLLMQENTNADIVSFNYVQMQSNGVVKKVKSNIPQNVDDLKLQLLRRNFKCVIWSLLIRVSLYKENGVRVVDGVDMGEDYQVSPILFYYAKKIVHLEDCMYFYFKNEKSYTSSFDEKKAMQALKSIDVLTIFFESKSLLYKEAVIQGEAKVLAMFMMGCARANERSFGELLRRRMDKIPIVYISNVPIVYRLTYYIRDFNMLHLYAIIGNLIKRKIGK